ncbi:MAG: helix-turn-helix domain-containing protein [Candidatus Hodarchaeota archaeon]
MLVTRGYKYALRVNNKERTLLQQCAGTARFSWNWGLAQRVKRYKTHTGND